MKEIKVLIVDDSLVVLKVIGRFLAENGFSVYMSDSAEKALNLAEKTNFDLVVADFNLRAGSGIQLIDKIKKSHPKVKSILTSGHFDFNDKLLKRQNIDAFLQKPFEGKELESLIKSILK